jgi:glycosyltransferase involved in cell wall biosynthesis
MTESSLQPKLRFCLIGPAYPYRGGISHYNTCLAIELAKRHDVHSINYSRLYPDFLFPGKTQYDESSSPLKAPSIRLIDSVNPLTWVRTAFHITRRKPDVVLVQWWHPFFAPAIFTICLLIKLMTRTRILFLCHNVVPHETSIIDRFLSGIAFSIADSFIVQSGEDMANLLRMKKRSRAALNPHPLYDFFKKSGLGREEAKREIGTVEERLILFFGYIRPYKGLSFLIEAMPEIREKTGAGLMVVGEFYEPMEQYLESARERGMDEVITFVDRYVGNEEVEAFFTASDLVVLPYISATQSGIVQIAISFDRPVIVTDVGGLPEVVSEGKTGFIVPPSDAGAIARAVAEFYEGDWAEKMKPHFAGERERFSWAGLVFTIEGLVGSGDDRA